MVEFLNSQENLCRRTSHFRTLQLALLRVRCESCNNEVFSLAVDWRIGLGLAFCLSAKNKTTFIDRVGHRPHDGWL